MSSILAPITAILIAVAFTQFGHGLQSTILPIRAEMESFGSLTIGIMSSSYYIGFVLGCWRAPHLVLLAGHIRAFAAIISIGSASALLYPIIIDPLIWIISRMVTGFCIAGFYIIIESWLNDRATNETRGFVMSAYVIVMLSMITVGQLALIPLDLKGYIPFIIASILWSMAVVPVALTRSAQPAALTLVNIDIRRLYRNSPAAIIGSFLVGAANSSLWSLAPFYALLENYPSTLIPVFAAAIVVGGLVFQWPVGRLSDKVDRRIVLAFSCALGAMVCMLMFISSAYGPWATIIGAFIVGALTQPAYSVAVAHGYDHAEEGKLVETGAGLLLVFGVGSAIGPIIAAWLMSSYGANALFSFAAFCQVLLALYLVQHIALRPASVEIEKTDFDMAATATVGAVMTPELYDEEEENIVVPEMWMPDTAEEAAEVTVEDEEAVTKIGF